MTSESYALVAAIFSAIATALAAIATWRAPLAAARLAEKMRRNAEIANRRYDEKMRLFTTLMQERAAVYSDSGVRALNLIDVVFNDSAEVRKAWVELLASYDPAAKPSPEVQHSYLLVVLSAIAADLGLSAQITSDDLARIYYPNALSEEQLIRDTERQLRVKQIREQLQASATSAGTLPVDLWPPKPV